MQVSAIEKTKAGSLVRNAGAGESMKAFLRKHFSNNFRI